MKRFYLKKEVTMILFFIFLILFSTMNIISTLPYFTIDKEKDKKAQIGQVEAIMNAKLYQKYTFIETYGFLQEVLMKKEFNAFEVVKDDKENLYLQTYTDGPADISKVINKVYALEQYVKGYGGNFISFIMPDKYIRNKTVYPKGYPYDYANETLDIYKENLKAKNNTLFDIRSMIEQSSLTQEQLFYKTDHHWRTETAFQAYVYLLSELKKQENLDLDPTGFYQDKNNYNFITYPSMFLGSIGRKTGVSYAGIDDFTFIYPKYATDFKMKWSLDSSTFTKTGRFETTLANPSYLNYKGTYDEKSDTYAMYLDGNAAFTSITNKKADNKLRVLFLKDSYSLPLAAFFANTVEQVDLLDPRYYKGDLTTFFKDHHYDYIFNALSVSSLQDVYFPDFINN